MQAAITLGTTVDGRMVQTAEHLSGAAIILGHDLGIVALSPAAEPLLRAGTHLTQRRGRLAPRCPRAAAILHAATMLMAGETGALAATLPLLLPASDGIAPLVADLCPLPTQASGPLSRGRALLAIRVPKADPIADTALVAAFGLTPSEGAIAILLAEGHDLRTIADRRGTAIATVRTQLKSLFEKTGCRRQTELVLALRRYC